jgi:hypothetical protein
MGKMMLAAIAAEADIRFVHLFNAMGFGAQYQTERSHGASQQTDAPCITAC